MGDEVISEKCSEKRNRGRPKLLHPALRAIYAQGQPYTSERTIQNTAYHIRAFRLLRDEPWVEWLINYTSKEGKPGHIRKTILAELGRLDHDEDLVRIARVICTDRLSTRKALAMIRQFRLGGMPEGSVSELMDVLRYTVIIYLREHADVSWFDARVAVADLFQLIDKASISPHKTTDRLTTGSADPA